MISKVEHQRHGLDLIKIDNDDTKLYLQTMVQELFLGNTMITISF